MSALHVTVIQAGEIRRQLQERVGTYIPMFETMFERASFSVTLNVVRLFDGAPLPRPVSGMAVLVTGSSAGVHDGLPWVDRLADYIREADAANLPMVGICFGHQIIAHALGGEVGRNPQGWELGRQIYDVAAHQGAFAPSKRRLAVACSHQDQVLIAPPGSTVVLASDATPVAGLAYDGGRVLTFQPHPEFPDAYAAELIALRRHLIPPDRQKTAIASLSALSDSPVLADAIGRTLALAGRP